MKAGFHQYLKDFNTFDHEFVKKKIDLAISDSNFRLATNKPDAVRKQPSNWM